MLRKIPKEEAFGDSRSFPRYISDLSHLDAFVDSGTINSLAPVTPFITKQTPIVAMGSCFAENISRKLAEKSYDILPLISIDRLFTPLSVQGFIEALTRASADFIRFQNWPTTSESIAQTSARLMNGATVIITLGLSTTWVDLQTGEFIPDPSNKVGARLVLENKDRYEMRQLSIVDVSDSIFSIVDGIRKLNMRNKIIFTLSPIPLSRAVCDYPVVVSDCISKSTLRVAIHELMQAGLKDIYYFPAFEILRWLAPMADTIWGADGQISHIRDDWIEYVMSKFLQFYSVDHEKVMPPSSAKFGELIYKRKE